jgi:hypothetical protein
MVTDASEILAITITATTSSEIRRRLMSRRHIASAPPPPLVTVWLCAYGGEKADWCGVICFQPDPSQLSR